MAKRSSTTDISKARKENLISSLKKPATLSQVAELAGVSRWVAGAVLNKGAGNIGCSKENRKRILDAAKMLNYQPNFAARTLRGKNSQVYGLLVASAGDPLRSFLVQYLDVESIATGRQVFISNTIGNPNVGPNRFEQCVMDFAHRKVDGVFCAVHHWFAGDRQFLLQMHPKTVFYEDPGIANTSFVAVDRAEAIRIAVNHLVSQQGRQRIAITLMSRENTTQLVRFNAYRQSLEANGMPFHPELVLWGCDHGAGYAYHDPVENKWSFPTNVIETAITLLVDQAGADAVIAYDDFWGATMISRLLKRRKRVPEDVAVIGYLNHYLADWTAPSLTSIDINHTSAAKQMVRMLDEMVNTPTEQIVAKKVLIKPRLIVRDSG